MPIAIVNMAMLENIGIFTRLRTRGFNRIRNNTAPRPKSSRQPGRYEQAAALRVTNGSGLPLAGWVVNMSSSLTQLIHRAQDGDHDAVDALYAETYADLRRLARWRLRACGRQTSLDTCSLVHESYIRFAESSRLKLEGRVHFMRWAAQVMRSVIVDVARRRLAGRRGGSAARATLDVELAAAPSGEAEIVGVHQALDRIAMVDPRLTQVVEMRYFAG